MRPTWSIVPLPLSNTPEHSSWISEFVARCSLYTLHAGENSRTCVSVKTRTGSSESMKSATCTIDVNSTACCLHWQTFGVQGVGCVDNHLWGMLAYSWWVSASPYKRHFGNTSFFPEYMRVPFHVYLQFRNFPTGSLLASWPQQCRQSSPYGRHYA